MYFFNISHMDIPSAECDSLTRGSDSDIRRRIIQWYVYEVTKPSSPTK